MSIEARLITAEEYLQIPRNGIPTELVRGEIVEMNLTQRGHSFLCGRITTFLNMYAMEHKLGFAGSNDGGVITQRNPDTVRGPDVAFFSFERLPAGEPLVGYASLPDLVVEVRSPSDRIPEILAKASEYLAAGIDTVVLVDPEESTASVFTATHGPQTYSLDEILILPSPFEGLRHTVRHWLDRALDR